MPQTIISSILENDKPMRQYLAKLVLALHAAVDQQNELSSLLASYEFDEKLMKKYQRFKFIFDPALGFEKYQQAFAFIFGEQHSFDVFQQLAAEHPYGVELWVNTPSSVKKPTIEANALMAVESIFRAATTIAKNKNADAKILNGLEVLYGIYKIRLEGIYDESLAEKEFEMANALISNFQRDVVDAIAHLYGMTITNYKLIYNEIEHYEQMIISDQQNKTFNRDIFTIEITQNANQLQWFYYQRQYFLVAEQSHQAGLLMPTASSHNPHLYLPNFAFVQSGYSNKALTNFTATLGEFRHGSPAPVVYYENNKSKQNYGIYYAFLNMEQQLQFIRYKLLTVILQQEFSEFELSFAARNILAAKLSHHISSGLRLKSNIDLDMLIMESVKRCDKPELAQKLIKSLMNQKDKIETVPHLFTHLITASGPGSYLQNQGNQFVDACIAQYATDDYMYFCLPVNIAGTTWGNSELVNQANKIVYLRLLMKLLKITDAKFAMALGKVKAAAKDYVFSMQQSLNLEKMSLEMTSELAQKHATFLQHEKSLNTVTNEMYAGYFEKLQADVRQYEVSESADNLVGVKALLLSMQLYESGKWGTYNGLAQALLHVAAQAANMTAGGGCKSANDRYLLLLWLLDRLAVILQDENNILKTNTLFINDKPDFIKAIGDLYTIINTPVSYYFRPSLELTLRDTRGGTPKPVKDNAPHIENLTEIVRVSNFAAHIRVSKMLVPSSPELAKPFNRARSSSAESKILIQSFITLYKQKVQFTALHVILDELSQFDNDKNKTSVKYGESSAGNICLYMALLKDSYVNRYSQKNYLANIELISKALEVILASSLHNNDKTTLMLQILEITFLKQMENYRSKFPLLSDEKIIAQLEADRLSHYYVRFVAFCLRRIYKETKLVSSSQVHELVQQFGLSTFDPSEILITFVEHQKKLDIAMQTQSITDMDNVTLILGAREIDVESPQVKMRKKIELACKIANRSLVNHNLFTQRLTVIFNMIYEVSRSQLSIDEQSHCIINIIEEEFKLIENYKPGNGEAVYHEHYLFMLTIMLKNIYIARASTNNLLTVASRRNGSLLVVTVESLIEKCVAGINGNQSELELLLDKIRVINLGVPAQKDESLDTIITDIKTLKEQYQSLSNTKIARRLVAPMYSSQIDFMLELCKSIKRSNCPSDQKINFMFRLFENIFLQRMADIDESQKPGIISSYLFSPKKKSSAEILNTDTENHHFARLLSALISQLRSTYPNLKINEKTISLLQDVKLTEYRMINTKLIDTPVKNNV